MAIKKTITDPIKAKLLSEQHTKFQPYLDRIAAAKNAGDAAAIKSISKELHNAMHMVEVNAQAEMHPKLTEYISQANLAYNFQKKIKLLQGAKIFSSTEPLPDGMKTVLSNIINEGRQLVMLFQERTSISLTLQDIVRVLEQRIMQ